MNVFRRGRTLCAPCGLQLIKKKGAHCAPLRES